jgi:hypothetical protein
LKNEKLEEALKEKDAALQKARKNNDTLTKKLVWCFIILVTQNRRRHLRIMIWLVLKQRKKMKSCERREI